MCGTCGCRTPYDDHGDDRHLTLPDLLNAALVAAIPWELMLQNAQQALMSVDPVRSFLARAKAPRLVSDIDGTLAQRDYCAIVAVNARFGTAYRYDDLRETQGDWIQEPDARAWWKQHRHDPIFLVDLPAYGEARWALRSLHQAGYSITVASDRESELTEISRTWLTEHEVPFDDLHIGEGEKLKLAESASETDPVCFFDDNPARAADLPREGVTVYLLDRPWNQDVQPSEHVVRVKSWVEILDHLPAMSVQPLVKLQAEAE